MFEDIFKKTETAKTNGKLDISIDFKESYWEEIKKDPSKLGEILNSKINLGLNPWMKNRHGMSKSVCTKHEVIEWADGPRLRFEFEVYDISDPEEEKKYMKKLDPEDLKFYKLNKEK